MIAMAALPALAIDMDEATSLAGALERVREYYPVTLGLSDKHMALVALAVTAGRIYGKRALVIVGGPSPGASQAPGATMAPPPAQRMPDIAPAESSVAASWFAAEPPAGVQ